MDVNGQKGETAKYLNRMTTAHFTNKDQLDATGERFTTELRGKIAEEHLHRYALAGQLAAGKIVLDIACGEGYGTNLLSTVAKQVIGVDIASEAIAHAKAKYTQANVNFRLGSCQKIPVDDNSIDLAISFETIEHVEEHDLFLTELKRVLKPEGMLIISSPNKENYSDHANYDNPYHLKELYFHQFSELTKKYFKQTAYANQSHSKYSLISTLDGAHLNITGNFKEFEYQSVENQSEYTLAYCSDASITAIAPSTFSLKHEVDNNQKCTLFISQQPNLQDCSTSTIYYSSETACTLSFKNLHELLKLGTNYIRIDPSECPGLLQLKSIDLTPQKTSSDPPIKIEISGTENLICLDQSIQESGWYIATDADPQIRLSPITYRDGEHLDLSLELIHYENSTHLSLTPLTAKSHKKNKFFSRK